MTPPSVAPAAAVAARWPRGRLGGLGLSALLGGLLAAACSTVPPIPELSPEHPASPHATEAPRPPASSTLTMPVRVPPTNQPGKPGSRMRGH